jgi:prophage regulatory protein
MTDLLLRRPQVEARTGLSRSSIYRLMEAGAFPRPIRIGLRAVAWRASDLDRWQAARPPALPPS